MPAVLVVILWAALSIVLSGLGLFRSSPGGLPLAFMAAVVAPPAIFGLAYAQSSRVRDYALGLDLRLLTAVQAWRVIGGMFLVLMTFGLVPRVFAWPAGVGDLIVGGYAPFVLVALARGAPGWRRQVVLLNLLGLLDLVGAIGTGILSGTSPIGVLREQATSDVFQQLPLSIIPAFLVPAWIIAHIISLMQLRRADPAAQVPLFESQSSHSR